jgi:hypothetical protein
LKGIEVTSTATIKVIYVGAIHRKTILFCRYPEYAGQPVETGFLLKYHFKNACVVRPW